MISVVIPTYNAEAFLAESINSILSQTHKDLEVVVVDDGSTDSTPDLIEYFAKKDKRVRYFRLPENKGISYARNVGMRESLGEYIAVMDADDISSPTRLKKQLKALKGDFVYSSYFLADEHGHIVGTHYPPAKVTFEDIKKNGAWPHVTILAKRECFTNNPYREDFKINDDAWLVWSFFKAGYKANWVKEPLVIVRTHQGSVSNTKKVEVAKTQDIMDREYNQYESTIGAG